MVSNAALRRGSLRVAHFAKMSGDMTNQTRELERMSRPLDEVDPEIAEVIRNEVRRQATGIELIPSENFVSEAVLEAMGSVLTNKYAEGYPGKRYYGGCEFVDIAEQLAIDRAKALFGAEHANVQPHSGTQANMAVYMAALQPGDTVLGMNLAHGGHLTHGHPLNFSGKMYKFVRVRRDQGNRNNRLRRTRPPRAGAQAEDGGRGRERLFAHHRFRAHGKDRAVGGRDAVRRHGAHRRAGRGGRASEPGAARRFRDHHHAQDAARAARRHDSLPRKIRQGRGPQPVPRRTGRPADAHHRGKSCLPEGSDGAGIPRISEADRGEREGAGGGTGQARVSHRQRRHGQSPVSAGDSFARDYRKRTRSRRSTARASPSTRTRFRSIRCLR